VTTLANVVGKVLLISYWFPPRAPEFAGKWAEGVAKYLPEFGWEPLVLTAKLPKQPNRRYHTVETPYHDSPFLYFSKKLFGIRSEQTLLMYIAELKNKFRITSATSLLDGILKLGGEIIAYPDVQRAWRSPAVKVAGDLLKTRSVDAILSISPPVTAHLIAADLKEKYGVPWVGHFQDLWSQNPYYPYRSLRRRLDQKLEIRTMAWADTLVAISQPHAEKLSRLHGEKPVHTITGGFDPERLVTPPPQLSAKFTITYTGNIYPGKQSPEPLFKALTELISEGVINRKDVEVRFYGSHLMWVQQQIDFYHLKDIAKQLGILTWQASIEKQSESQLLLLLDWTDPDEQGVYTGKVFQYLASRRPILAVGGSRNDVVGKLLEETKTGVHCLDVEEIKSFLKQAYREYREQGQVNYCGNKRKIMNYSYREVAHGFSELLSQLVPSHTKVNLNL